MKMNLPTRKELNRQRLEECAEVTGDLILTEMFWNMFEDLSATKQEYYIDVARKIVKAKTGLDIKKLKR